MSVFQFKLWRASEKNYVYNATMSSGVRQKNQGYKREGREGEVNKRSVISKIGKYLNDSCHSENDIPTLSGLALYLGVDKSELEGWERGEDKELKNAVVSAKNKIEHFFISQSALKRINSSTAHFYLKNAFNYEKDEKKEETESFSVTISVEDEEGE